MAGFSVKDLNGIKQIFDGILTGQPEMTAGLPAKELESVASGIASQIREALKVNQKQTLEFLQSVVARVMASPGALQLPVDDPRRQLIQKVLAAAGEFLDTVHVEYAGLNEKIREMLRQMNSEQHKKVMKRVQDKADGDKVSRGLRDRGTKGRF